MLLATNPDSWAQYVALNAHVYDAVKSKYPDLKVFPTLQYEYLRGIETGKVNRETQIKGVRQLLNHADLTALSTYKYGILHPNPVTESYFDLALSFGKPVALAESGAMSETTTVGTMTLEASEDDQKQFVVMVLDAAKRYKFPFVINWVAIDFDRLATQLPPDVQAIANAWVHSGLETADGRAKPAMALWREALAQ